MNYAERRAKAIAMAAHHGGWDMPPTPDAGVNRGRIRVTGYYVAKRHPSRPEPLYQPIRPR